MLAFTGHQARRWEPKKPRYRVFTIAATLARSGRRTWLHLSTRSAWATLTLTGLGRLADLAPTDGDRDPAPTTPPDPGPGTGAHPGRHRTPCHTHRAESRTHGTRTARLRKPAVTVKDRG